jgi:hypothetical protein
MFRHGNVRGVCVPGGASLGDGHEAEGGEDAGEVHGEVGYDVSERSWGVVLRCLMAVIVLMLMVSLKAGPGWSTVPSL